MSAPKPLKAMSLRDSLGKTVRLLTKQGVDVQFRGHQPFVQTRGNKVTRLVLPEVNDSASPELIEALQGFLDHEVGHIFYTPFATAERYAAGNRIRHSLCNIVEDIRLEKLLPRDLPGTKDNLERMYENVMDTFFGPPALEAKDPNMSKSEAFSRVLVVGMRALSGQKAFQTFMDDNDLWPHFMPLIKKMPNISRRLRDLEDFKDVTSLVDDILAALAPEKKDEDENAEKKPDPNADPTIDPDAQDAKDDGASDDSAGDDKEDGEDSDDTGGEGHGDGEGTDDGEDDEDSGSCKGGPGEDDGDADGDGDEDADDSKGSKGDDADDGDEGDTPADSDLESHSDSTGSGKDGKENRTLRDALALLEPTQRRALFLYKKKQQTVEQIANDLNKTEDETVDLLAAARKRLRDLLNGG